MLDQQGLITVLRLHGFEVASLIQFALFETGASYWLTVKGAEAMTKWRTLRDLVGVTGYWPIIVGNYECLEEMVNRGEQTRSPQDIIEEGLRLDAEYVLRRRVEQYRLNYDTPLSEVLSRGAWPGPGEIPPISSMIAGEQFESVAIALFPTVEGWHIPAYLYFGAWNDCPSPHEHVCLLKHWYEHYGADLAGMTHATVELLVKHPPQDRENALRLAWEQFVYCHETIGYDLVTNTLEDLAARLLNAPLWHFWWD